MRNRRNTTGEAICRERLLCMMQEDAVAERFVRNKIIERSQCLSEGRHLGPQGRHGKAGKGGEVAELRKESDKNGEATTEII